MFTGRAESRGRTSHKGNANSWMKRFTNRWPPARIVSSTEVTILSTFTVFYATTWRLGYRKIHEQILVKSRSVVIDVNDTYIRFILKKTTIILHDMARDRSKIGKHKLFERASRPTSSVSFVSRMTNFFLQFRRWWLYERTRASDYGCSSRTARPRSGKTGKVEKTENS